LVIFFFILFFFSFFFFLIINKNQAQYARFGDDKKNQWKTPGRLNELNSRAAIHERMSRCVCQILGFKQEMCSFLSFIPVNKKMKRKIF